MDDVINAGSAVRGTAGKCGQGAGAVVVIAALLAPGDAADSFATAQGVPLPFRGGPSASGKPRRARCGCR